MTDTQDNPATAPDKIAASPEGGAFDAVKEPVKDTIVAGAVDDKTPQVPADFPEDWRVKLSAGDTKELARLERFGSPTDVYKAYRALEQKMSSGKLKSDLPQNATPEQLTEWRKDNGVPETPDGYDTSLSDITIGENDKPLVDEFLKEMHNSNASPTAVKSALKAYYNLVEKQNLERESSDIDFKAESLGELQSEWGADFRKNVNMVANLLATAPTEIAQRIEASRTPEGHKFGDDPAMMKWFNQLAREVNPAAAVVPNAGSNAANAMADEKKAIEAKMGTAAYTQADRERHMEIVNAELKMANRNAA